MAILAIARVVPGSQPNRMIPGDASVKKDEMKLVSERKIGNTRCRVYRPILTDEERERRMKAVYRAIVECYRAPKKAR